MLVCVPWSVESINIALPPHQLPLSQPLLKLQRGFFATYLHFQNWSLILFHTIATPSPSEYWGSLDTKKEAMAVMLCRVIGLVSAFAALAYASSCAAEKWRKRVDTAREKVYTSHEQSTDLSSDNGSSAKPLSANTLERCLKSKKVSNNSSHEMHVLIKTLL